MLAIFEDFVFPIQRILKYPWIQMFAYRCLLIGRVQYLYTIEHAVKNITYYRL